MCPLMRGRCLTAAPLCLVEVLGEVEQPRNQGRDAVQNSRPRDSAKIWHTWHQGNRHGLFIVAVYSCATCNKNGLKCHILEPRTGARFQQNRAALNFCVTFAVVKNNQEQLKQHQ